MSEDHHADLGAPIPTRTHREYAAMSLQEDSELVRIWTRTGVVKGLFNHDLIRVATQMAYLEKEVRGQYKEALTMKQPWLAEALDHIDTLAEYAYKEGFHEMGYEPNKRVRKFVEAVVHLHEKEKTDG